MTFDSMDATSGENSAEGVKKVLNKADNKISDVGKLPILPCANIAAKEGGVLKSRKEGSQI